MRYSWILSACVANVCLPFVAMMMLQKPPVHGMMMVFRWSLRSSRRLLVGQRSVLSLTPNPDPDTAGMIHTAAENDSSTSTRTSNKSTLSSFDVSASRLGLDPASNRFHAPIVNHENYSFSDWPANHTFPVRTVSMYQTELNCTELQCTGICRTPRIHLVHIPTSQAYTTVPYITTVP
jgi:hypothetical protein